MIDEKSTPPPVPSALIKDVAPGIPVVHQCHATSLRQMELCPHQTEQMRKGYARNDQFVVFHNDHARVLRESYAYRARRASRGPTLYR